MGLFKSSQEKKAEKANELYQRGRQAMDNNRIFEAINSFEQAIVIMDEIGERRGEFATRYNLGSIYIQAENFQQARDHLVKALDLAKALGMQQEQIHINFMIGRSMRFSGDAAGALPYLEESARLCRQLNDAESLPSVLNNLGLAYRHTHNPGKARLTYEEALQLSGMSANIGMKGAVHNNLAMTYLDMGDLEKAKMHLGAALPLRQNVGDMQGVAETLQNLVEVHTQAGDSMQAAHYAGQLKSMFG